MTFGWDLVVAWETDIPTSLSILPSLQSSSPVIYYWQASISCAMSLPFLSPPWSWISLGNVLTVRRSWRIPISLSPLMSSRHCLMRKKRWEGRRRRWKKILMSLLGEKMRRLISTSKEISYTCRQEHRASIHQPLHYTPTVDQAEGERWSINVTTPHNVTCVWNNCNFRYLSDQECCDKALSKN